jgi:hypothetical protein
LADFADFAFLPLAGVGAGDFFADFFEDGAGAFLALGIVDCISSVRRQFEYTQGPGGGCAGPPWSMLAAHSCIEPAARGILK